MGELVIADVEIDRVGWPGSGPHGSGPVRVVTIHCTTGPPGSLEGARATLHAKRAESNSLIEHRSTVPGGRRHVQLVDGNRASKALRNLAGATETNRAGVNYQIELVGPAEDPVAGTTADDWRWFGAELGKIGQALGIRNAMAVEGHRFYPYPPTRWQPPQYLGREFWRTVDDRDQINGWVAHGEWTENVHGDPGDLTSPDPRLDGYSPYQLMLEGAAITNPAGSPGIIPPTLEDPMANITIADIEAAASRAATKAVASLAHAGKAVCARDDRDGRVFVVSGAGKFHAVNWDILQGLAVLGQLRPVDRAKIPVIDGAKYLQHLPDLGAIDAGVDELVDMHAAKSADLAADSRELIAALEALTGPDAMPVTAQ